MSTTGFGAALVLLAAAAVLRRDRMRQREAQALVWAFAAALGEAESAIRWQRTPVPALLETLAARERCGAWFRQVLDELQGDMPLQTVWDSVFSVMPDAALAEVLRRVSWSGDARQLEGTLARAKEEAEGLYRRRCEEDRRSRRVRTSAVLCGAALTIILLL